MLLLLLPSCRRARLPEAPTPLLPRPSPPTSVHPFTPVPSPTPSSEATIPSWRNDTIPITSSTASRVSILHAVHLDEPPDWAQSVISLAFSPDSRLLAIPASDSIVRLYDLVALHVVSEIPVDPYDRFVAFSPTEDLLAVWGDNTAQLFPLLSTAPNCVINVGDQGGVDWLSFSPDGRTLALAVRNLTLQVWDTATCQQRSVPIRDQLVTHALYSPDGLTLAASVGGRTDPAILLLDATRFEVRTVLHGSEDAIATLAFQPGSTLIAAAGWDSVVRVWDTVNGELVQQLPPAGGWVNQLDFSPDGSVLALGSQGSSLQLWDTSTWTEITSFAGDYSDFEALQFSPDGLLLASSGVSPYVRLWGVQNE